jgi:type I restriction enzyme S subunit
MHWSWLAEFDKRPADWQVEKLGGLIEIIAGQSPDGSTVTQSGEGLPFLQGNAEFTETSPKAEFWCSAARKRCLPNDTLISVRAPVGEMNRADQAYGLGRGLAALRATKIDTDFLYYGMQLWRKSFGRVAQGTTFDAISERHFRQMWVCFPREDSEQKAIAAGFALVDKSITAVRESIAKAERLQKGLMQQLLTGHLKPDGTPRHKKEFWEHPKAGLVPIGWQVSPLKQLAQINRGKFSHRPRNEPRFYGGPYPFIQTGDVSNSRGYIVSHSQTLSEEGIRISRRFPKGTIFISIVGVNVAATSIASYDVYATDSVIGMIPYDGIVSEYLEFYMRSVQQKLAVLAGDSARENLNYGLLRPLLVKYPTDPKEQRQIADILCNCESLIRAKEQKIAALQRLKKSLMQNLLTGRIRLPVEKTAKKGK